MPINVQCDACGKKYKVADKLAGKKVRCKACNAVMSVSTDIEPEDVAPEPDLSAVAPEGFSLDRAIANAHRQAAQGRSGAGDSGSHSHLGDSGVSERDGDEEGETPAVSVPAYAANPAFRFGGAAELDAALPWVLAAISIGWLVLDTFHTGDPKHGWVAQVRCVLYLLFYAAIVFPLVGVGVNRASAKFRFGKPKNAAIKRFSAFAFPYTLGMVLALHGGGVIHFVIGALLGLIVGLAAFWFFYRLRPWQTSGTLLTSGGFFAIGATVALGVMVGASAAMLTILNGYKTAYTFAQSPVGPFLSWNTPPAPVEEKENKSEPVDIASGATSQPAGENSPQTPVAGATSEPTTNPAVATSQPATPADSAVAANTSPNPTPNGTDSPPAESPAKSEEGGAAKPVMVAKADPAKETVAAIPTPTPVEPPTPTPEVKGPTALADEAPPALVAPPKELPAGEFDDVAFPPMAAPSLSNALAALVKSRGAVSDDLELWSIGSGEKKAAASPQHPAGSTCKYVVSSRGTVVAWMVDFPRKQVEVRGLGNDKFSKEIVLDTENNGDPTLLGFGLNDQLVIFWDHGGDCAVQGISYLTGQSIKNTVVHGWAKGSGYNVAMSPDGKYVALASDGDIPSVQIVEMYGSRPEPRRIMLNDLQHKTPNFSGMAFIADGSKLAIMYEEGKNTLLLGCRVQSGQVYARQVFFDVLMADHPAIDEYKGPAIDWLRGDAQWLLYGRVVVDTEKSIVIGKVGIPGVKSHAVLDKETIAFVAPGATQGKEKLLIGKLPPAPKALGASRPVVPATNADVARP